MQRRGPRERRFRDRAFGRSQARRAGNAHRRPADALAAARCGEPAFQGTRACRRLDRRYRGRGRRLPEPDHLLFSHQGSAVRRSGVSRGALRRPRRRAARRKTALALGLHARAGRERDGIGRAGFLRRSDDADPPPPGSRAADRAHRRAAARRGLARLCRRDGGAGLADTARSGNQRAAFLGDRDRRHARGAAEMLRLLGPQADASPGTARLKLVGARNSQPDTSPAGKEKQP
jgi:hypothetical protein